MNQTEKDLIIDSKHFSYTINALRSFFLNKGYIEVHTQNRLSILAACEDPSTIQTYNYANNLYPLPQTGQMWLEYELLTNPEPPGYFCVSTSYPSLSLPSHINASSYNKLISQIWCAICTIAQSPSRRN